MMPEKPSTLLAAGLPPSRMNALVTRVAGALLAVMVLAVAVMYAVPRAVRTGPSPDELSWGQRSLAPWWFPYERIWDKSLWAEQYRKEYTWCIHHPSLGRIVYRTVLGWAGHAEPPKGSWKHGASYSENLTLGNVLPKGMQFVLRLTNTAFYAAAAVLTFLGLNRILANSLLATLGVLTFIFEPTLTSGYKAVVPYVGADALFVFLLVLFWYAWLLLGRRPLACALALGIIGGLASSAKVNGAFALVAAAVFLAWTARGWLRLALPVLTVALASAIFLALNPVYFGGGFAWGARVLRDTLGLMFNLKEVTTATSWGSFTRFETFAAAFPYYPFLVPAAVLLWQSRREPWFAATFAWAASIIAMNLALIYMPQPRYAAPVRVAFLILVMACGSTLWRRLMEPTGLVCSVRPRGGMPS